MAYHPEIVRSTYYQERSARVENLLHVMETEKALDGWIGHSVQVRTLPTVAWSGKTLTPLTL